MLLPIPHWITALFIFVTLFVLAWTIVGLWRSSYLPAQKSANAFALLLMMWCIFQSTLALNGWYMDRTSSPPHLAFALLTPTVLFLLMLAIPFTRSLLKGISLFHLSFVHIVRIPVEICLWQLYVHHQVPQSMTFEGFNYDIIMGLSALPISVMVYRNTVRRPLLLIWNGLGLVMLAIVVTTAIGAAPTGLQWRDFAQPNFAVTHFPFIWLPSFVVPVVAISHVLSIIKLLQRKG